MMLIKAKIRGSENKWHALIFISSMWRVFCTPFAIAKEVLKPHSSARRAKAAANDLAAKLNINLEWED